VFSLKNDGDNDASILTSAPYLVDTRDFGDFVAVINKEISDIDLALRRSVDEYNGTAIIALVRQLGLRCVARILILMRFYTIKQVNTKGDEVAQLATTYTANEIAFFKRVVRLDPLQMCQP
jgi:hypothetical protein